MGVSRWRPLAKTSHAMQCVIGGQRSFDLANNRDDDVIDILEMRLVIEF